MCPAKRSLHALWVCLRSWNVGPVHLISFSTEVYFYLEQGIHLVEWQYEWLENDLKVSVSYYNSTTSAGTMLAL